MKYKARGLALACALALAGVSSVTVTSAFAAGVPVIDAAAIAKAVEQLGQMKAQLGKMTEQLQQAQQLNASLTGGRGMEGLLAGELRNVIPTNWQETLAQMNGGAKISDLAKSIKQQASKIDTGLMDKLLTSNFKQTTEGFANSAASQQASAGQVYDNASARFGRLQSLMDEIPRATDMKAIADLQARIQVEQTMLQNETIKMQALAQASDAQRALEVHQARELGMDRPSGPVELPLVYR